MTAPPLTAPSLEPQTDADSTPIAEPINGHPVVISGRFAWERQLRSAKLSRTVKGFLLYLGTFMDGSGRNCRPSSRTIMDDWSISRERAFELFSEAEQTGWIRTRQRPGKPSERLPVIPTRQMPPDGSVVGTRQARPDGSAGSESADHVHPSGGTRRVKRGGAGGTRQARPDYTRQARPDATGTGQEQPGGTLPPDPLRTERTQAPTRTDHEQELILVPDHNDTRKVTSRTRAPAESCDRPLLAVIEDPEREIIWTEMQPTIHRVTQPPATGATA